MWVNTASSTLTALGVSLGSCDRHVLYVHREHSVVKKIKKYKIFVRTSTKKDPSDILPHILCHNSQKLGPLFTRRINRRRCMQRKKIQCWHAVAKRGQWTPSYSWRDTNTGRVWSGSGGLPVDRQQVCSDTVHPWTLGNVIPRRQARHLLSIHTHVVIVHLHIWGDDWTRSLLSRHFEMRTTEQ